MFFDSEVKIYYDLLKNDQILSQCGLYKHSHGLYKHSHGLYKQSRSLYNPVHVVHPLRLAPQSLYRNVKYINQDSEEFNPTVAPRDVPSPNELPYVT